MNLDWDDLKSMFIVTVGFIGGGGVGLAIFILAVGLVSAFLRWLEKQI